MQIYLVGGAVRDTLLGLPVKDRDWVVVGATPQQLLAQGYIAVGKDFPVFLHPQTRQEYALARIERSTAPGYKGFAVHAAPDVTLEQDLSRRDLTINAMAVGQAQLDAAGGFDPASVQLEDPFGGRRDLDARVLRHVTNAFQEDPVRILRVARFAARFERFAVADETLALMRRMVAAGEVDALVAERVWQELARGLMEGTPSRMLDVLRDCHALAHLLPELALAAGAPASDSFDGPSTRSGAGTRDAASHATDEVMGERPSDGHHDGPPCQPDEAVLRHVLDRAAKAHAPLTVRFAALALFMADDAARQQACERLRVPNDCRDLALLAARERDSIDASASLDAKAILQLLERCDALRKPTRFAELLLLCAIMAGALASSYGPATRLQQALDAACAVATEPIARRAMASGAAGAQVGEQIHVARVAAVAASIGGG